MYRYDIMGHIAQEKMIAIVREASAAQGHRVVSALMNAGISVLEVTCTTPGAFDVVDSLRDGQALVGVGTVLSASEAVDAAHAGARFIVTPNVDPDVIRTAHRHGLAALVGCATASEILTGLEAGADAIKVFPAEQLGMGFLAAIHGPVPWAPLIPVGGVDVSNARAWLGAGAVAVGLGSRLTAGDDAAIAERVRALKSQISTLETHS